MCRGGEIMTEGERQKKTCKIPKTHGGACKYNESFMVLLPTTVGVYFQWASVISPHSLLDDDL